MKLEGGRAPLPHHRHSPSRKSASLQAGRQATHSPGEAALGSRRPRQDRPPAGRTRARSQRGTPGHRARGPAVLARSHSCGHSPWPQQFLKMTKRGFNFSEEQDQSQPPGWLATRSPCGAQSSRLCPGFLLRRTKDQTHADHRAKESFIRSLHREQRPDISSYLKTEFLFFHQHGEQSTYNHRQSTRNGKEPTRRNPSGVTVTVK